MDICFQLNIQCLMLKLITMGKMLVILHNLLIQMDSEDNVVAILSYLNTLNLPKDICHDIVSKLEYQDMLYFSSVIEPNISYRYPNQY